MKSLLIALLIMAPLYLFLCQEQDKQMQVLSETSTDVAMGEQPVTERAGEAKSLQPYQQQLNKAKGVEAMLNQGVQDRMRSVDDLDSGK